MEDEVHTGNSPKEATAEIDRKLWGDVSFRSPFSGCINTNCCKMFQVIIHSAARIAFFTMHLCRERWGDTAPIRSGGPVRRVQCRVCTHYPSTRSHSVFMFKEFQSAHCISHRNDKSQTRNDSVSHCYTSESNPL